jgi:peptidoglycan-associated lipoprotein
MNRSYMNLIMLGIVVCTLMLFGCQKKAPVPEPVAPPSDDSGQKSDLTGEAGTPSEGEIEMRKLNEARSALSSTDIYFDFDQATLTQAAKNILSEKAKYMVKNLAIKVVIEGHCDERGSNEYNIALSQRRAAATKKYLVDFGVNAGNIEMVPYGEERPVCNESNESCWGKNRRAHFVVNNQ